MHDELETKLGKEGAKQARRSLRAMTALALISAAGLIYMWAGNPPQAAIAAWTVAVFISGGVVIAQQIKLARILSEHLHMPVHWYEIPQANHPRELNRWLEKKKAQTDS